MTVPADPAELEALLALNERLQRERDEYKEIAALALDRLTLAKRALVQTNKERERSSGRRPHS